MKVKVKKLTENAKLPVKLNNDNDFCYDVYATSCTEITPGVYKYGIGLAFEIVRGKEEIGTIKEADEFNSVHILRKALLDMNCQNIKLSLDLRPRSSIYKTGMMLANCEGTIDEFYRGEASAVFYHLIKKLPKYEVGDRIGQLKLGITFNIDWVEVDDLSDTVRGEGGFGSTGKK
jgi:dUTP pyrophosphatase